MAYAAVISLKQTIHRLLNSSRISIAPPSLKILRFAYEEVQSLQDVLEKIDSSSKSVNGLDRQITEEVNKLRDALESHLSQQIISHSESPVSYSCPLLFTLDLKEFKQDIDSSIQTIKKMKGEYIKELSGPSSHEEDDVVLSNYDFSGKKSKLVGLSRDFSAVFFELTKPLSTVALVGMAGIGKTTLAREIFEDSICCSVYEYRAWVTVGPKPRLKQIMLGILAQLNPNTDQIMLDEPEEKLGDYLFKSLRDRRYLIVLDDVWQRHIFDDLAKLIGYNNRDGRILVTTRLQEVASGAYRVHQMSFLNDEESWCLFRDEVFGEEPCPRELEKVGKKIAENCQGLPLLILAVAKTLFRDKRTVEYWNEVVERKNLVFVDANERIFEVLFRSYEYLPQHLKACLLYMGVFPRDYKIPCSKLVELWSVEGFLDEPIEFRTFKDSAVECIKDLVSKSLVIVRDKSSNDGIKTCSLHYAYWHWCVTEARRNGFFYVLDSRVDCLAEGVKSQRRLCVHNNILFGIRDAHDSIFVDSMVGSLLCTGPHHRYPVPICFDLKLLRVLDAITIRFYEFPMKVLKLAQLRYLALTYNGNLPRSISKLWNLQILIVHRNLNIKSYGVRSDLPMEIWDMKELKHIQITGSGPPDPNNITFLPNLVTLLDVSTLSFTKNVIEGLHNLEKLGFRIELPPDDADHEPPICFDHISHLDKLESLKCVAVNPKLGSHHAATIVPRGFSSHFPKSLIKLSLSGLGCPWEDMKPIASLPNLEVLKLRCYAFRGSEWVTGEWEFRKLRFFLIEDSDLVKWTAPFSSFQNIRRLIVKHCYRLEDIPMQFRARAEIEVVDSNPLAVTVKEPVRVKRIKPRYSWVG